MPFVPGTRVGPYEILTPLGAGGMGEVWKARDTRLDRVVAIKTSQARFSERFEREARSIAALNHPNICQIYDVGPDYLVMEYVEGTPIAPVDSPRKLLDIGVQMSDGLAAAHAARIVHRDLKPDNILVTREGRLKILDFGLAKSTAPEMDDEATRSVMLTQADATVGTIAYMSPEQARGNPNLTAQSDQFAMGLILYELAAGKRAFSRASAVETMTAIIREDAEPLPPSVPAPLRWIVERLLAKDPADRYDSTRDLYRELRQVRDRLSETMASGTVQSLASEPAPPVRAQPKARLITIVAAIAVLAAAAAWIAHPATGSGAQKYTPMEVSWEQPSDFVWSPDGKAFVYSAGDSGGRRVFLRYLNSSAAAPLTRGNGNWYPLGWSPDGKRVIIEGKNPQGSKPPVALFSVPLFGGEPQFMAAVPNGRFSAISPDGKTFATVGTDEHQKLRIFTASPVGSALKQYAPAPFSTDSFINTPKLGFSPDGKWILLMVDVLGGRQAWKLPYPQGSAPSRILSGLPDDEQTPFFSWFPGGRHVVMSLFDQQGLHQHLWNVGTRSGSMRQLTSGASSEAMPSVSPDGTKILLEKEYREYMIVSASLSDASVQRIISSELPTEMPAWAPHQAKLVYTSARNGSAAIWMRSEGWDRPIVTKALFPAGTTTGFLTPSLSPGADRVIYTRVDTQQRVEDWISAVSGGVPVRLTDTHDAAEFGGSWSPDGSQFVYWQFRNRKPSLMMVRTGGEVEPVLFRDDVEEALPEWSPDGQWIKYADKVERGGWSIVSPDGKTVRSFGEPHTIDMTFSADSRRLYGIRADGDHRYLYSIDIATKETKTIGDVGKDFTPNSASDPGIRLSLSPDGRSIVFPAFRTSSSLWMLEGFDPPTWTERLSEMLRF